MSYAASVPAAGSVAKQQKLLLLGGGAGLFALLIFLMWLADDAPKTADEPTTTGKVEQVEAVARKISDEEIWTAKADAALQEMTRNNEAMKQQMEAVKRENETLNAQMREQGNKVQGLEQAQASATEKSGGLVLPPALPALPTDTAGAALDSIVPPLPTRTAPILPPPTEAGLPDATIPQPPVPAPDDGMVHIVIGDESGDGHAADSALPEAAKPAEAVEPLSTAVGDNPTARIAAPDNVAATVAPAAAGHPQKKTYIPSGSFFKAELLASLDAPTGGNASQNPHPILLLVKDNAFLPNRFRSKAKECHVLASGYGDISSERVNMRTEKISCVLKDGTVIDTKLDAYIAGEDGKSGVRGNLVSKQGALIANAMLAGTLGGIGQGLAQAATTATQTSSGTVTSVSPNQALEFGLNTGAGNAMNKLADYYIKAAEKTFPILEVSAGREVSVILLSGLDMEMVGGTGQ